MYSHMHGSSNSTFPSRVLLFLRIFLLPFLSFHLGFRLLPTFLPALACSPRRWPPRRYPLRR